MSEDIWDPEHDWILQFEKLLNPTNQGRTTEKKTKTCHKHYEKITHQSSDLDYSEYFRVPQIFRNFMVLAKFVDFALNAYFLIDGIFENLLQLFQ